MRFFSKRTKLSFRAAAQPNGSKLPRHNGVAHEKVIGAPKSNAVKITG
jgi:hypothetical protein